MRSNVNRKPDVVFDDTPGWAYYIEEVSLSVWRVQAIHESGRSIETTAPGVDETQIVQRIHDEVLMIIAAHQKK